jgi:acetyl esterase/lipase
VSDDRLERAIGFVQSEKMAEARELLEQVLKADRTNIPAWHWYAQTWQNLEDKIRVWEACLRFNPENKVVQEALRDLNPLIKIDLEAKPSPRNINAGKASMASLAVWGTIGVLAAAAVWLVMFIQNSAPKDPAEYRHSQPVEYYLYAPDKYSADQEWPLFVGIHGAGGRGLDCWNMWQTFADEEGFILLCPSIPGDPNGFYQDVGENTVWSAIGEVKKEYRVGNRMFFAGFSAGAFFIQGFVYHYPQYVSGLAILSSGLYLDPRVFAELIPMTVVIGDADHAPSVQSSQTFVDGLRQYGFDVQYERMPGVGHAFTPTAQRLTIELFRKIVNK